MFFRFCSAIVLVVLISLAGTVIEKHHLQLRRLVSQQQYRLELLLEERAARRVEAQRWGAPLRLVETMPEPVESPAQASKSRKSKRKLKSQRKAEPRAVLETDTLPR